MKIEIISKFNFYEILLQNTVFKQYFNPIAKVEKLICLKS